MSKKAKQRLTMDSYTYTLYFLKGKKAWIAELKCNTPILPKDFQNGKNHRKTFQSKNRKEAITKMNEYILENLPKKDESYYVSCSLNNIFQNYICKKMYELKPSSLDRIISTFNTYISPVIGDKKIKHINTLDIQNIIRSNSQCSISTLKKIKYCLTAVFNYLIKELQALTFNPANNVIIPNTNKPKEREIYLDDEIDQIVEVSFTKKPNGDYLYRHSPIALFLFETGIREGEAVALKWSNLHVDKNNNKYISITNSISYSQIRDDDCNPLGRKSIESSTKSLKGVRDIPLTPDAVYALELLKEEQKHLKIKSDYIIAKKDGNYMQPKNLSACFKRILKYAGVRYKTLHSTRHTTATKLIYSNNMNISIVGDFLGQSTKSTTETYIHRNRNNIIDAFKDIDNNRRNLNK